MNSYNIFEEENYSTILYHAIARDQEQVIELAEAADYNIAGMTVELERKNVKDELGCEYKPTISDALCV